MPVTRSNCGAASNRSNRDEDNATNPSSSLTSTTATESSASRTTTATGTTATETTETSGTTNETTSTVSKEASNTVDPADATNVVVAKPVDHPPPQPPPSKKSIGGNKSTRSKSNRARLIAQAREELARYHVELAAARLAALEVCHSSDEEDDNETVIDERPTTTEVDAWLHSSRSHMLAITNEPHQHEPPRPTATEPVGATALPVTCTPHSNAPPTPPAPVATPAQPPLRDSAPHEHTELSPPGVARSRSEIAELTSAIVLAVKAGQQQQQQPRCYIELPFFHGAYQEWLAFKSAFYESHASFTDTENIARLRRCLRGRAREAVESSLYNNAKPEDIMRGLETRFGRPDSIALTELERLRSLPRPADTPKDLCIFANRVNNIVMTLRALGRTYYLYNPEITKVTTEKLPSPLRYRWFEFAAGQPQDEPDFIKLTNFLQREAEFASPFAQPEIVSGPPTDSHHTAAASPRRTQRTFTTTSDSSAAKCRLCEATGHYLSDCRKFIEADVNERWDIAKTHRLCFRCLRFRSKIHRCKPKKCNTDGCVHLHHSMLHTKREPQQQPESGTEAVTSTWTPNKTRAYLKIVKVKVSGPAGEEDAYALLDDGSTVTLIDRSLSEQVGARGPIDPLHIEAIADTKVAASRSRRVALTLKGTSQPHQINARTIENLQLSPQEITENDIADCSHLRDIEDELKYDNARPKILIGQDNWNLLMSTETRKGRHNQPVASLTPLGWVLHGARTRSLGQRVNYVNHLSTTEDGLDEQLRHYFALEALTINPKRPQSDPEQRALNILSTHTHATEDGRYQAPLLWKKDNITMPDNYDNALRRLVSIEKKLDRDPQLKARYHQQMAALVEKKYAEPAPLQKSENTTWYLPHFAVVNPKKPEKTRIVHDAAARTKNASLNDFLLTGPDLLQSLPGVLMRFRQHAIAVTADIAEMFMQVKVRPEDRDALRYLWRGDRRDGEPQQYRMTSLIFGASCSPSIAIFVKNLNAMKHEQTQPAAASAIVNNHYVDDYLDSYRTEDEAIKTASEVRDIHRGAHFELRKWASNSPRVMKTLEGRDTNKTTVDLNDGSQNERVLGLIWKPGPDELTFNLDLARIPEAALETAAPTKREVLKIMMSLYDPLGFASPVTIKAKQIMQEIWRRGSGWDTQIDPDLARQWVTWIEHLRNLHQVSIPRCYHNYSDATSLQLHVFTDASEEAYAAALYWRAVDPAGNVKTSLITAKARVAPLKLTSIPRLELQAAVMGARMAEAVKQEHTKKPESTTYWTDSRTVLTWLKTGSRSYRPFVAHRIAAIEDTSTVHEWRWIPTKLNVADDATRDVPPGFRQHHRWFVGPEFLLGHPSSWPTETCTSTQPTGEEKTLHVVENKRPHLNECTPRSEKFSRWERLLRATARVLQFIKLCRPQKHRTLYKRTIKNKEADPDWKKKRTYKSTSPKKPTRTERSISTKYIPIDAEELRRAEHLLIRTSQLQSFHKEIEDLRNNRSVSNSSRLRPLAVSLIDGIIRIKSRIAAADDVTSEQKQPPVLDGDNHITRLWIEYTHRQLLHAGSETTLNECRQHYWILRLRPTTRGIIHRCIPCRIRRNKPSQPPTGDHPPCRLAHHRRPFTYTGLDYFGPLTVTVGRTLQKRYVAIFTCLTTRAIHLEMAASLSTDSAVMALRRMMARRGCPTEIWSDNGTNLHGADKEIRKAMNEATELEASKKLIRWRYICPGAPFMGGAWERMVRSVKTALAATLHERHPTEEVLLTLLSEAEYTVNSHPLTHVSVHHEDNEALTPNHFLLGGSARVPVPGTFDERDLIGRTHWRASQHLANTFWSRWLREYLPELQYRREPHGRGPALKVGDVVLIVDGTLPRNTWPRGVITATFPGADGIVRVAEVRTRGGTLRRATKKLVILPTDPVAPHRDEENATST